MYCNYAWAKRGLWHVPLGVSRKTCLVASPPCFSALPLCFSENGDKT